MRFATWGVVVLVLILIGPGPAKHVVAEEGPEEGPPPAEAARPESLSAEQASKEVREAIRAGDQEALTALANRDDPDPWLVASHLCHLGAHDAAAVFASAARRAGTEALGAYVASRRGEEPDEAGRETLRLTREAMQAEDWPRVMELTAETGSSGDPVVRIATIWRRVYAVADLRGPRDAAEILKDLAGDALEIGWLRQAASALDSSGQCAHNSAAWDLSEASWRAALKINRDLGDYAGVANVLNDLGLLKMRLGDMRAAMELMREALRTYEEIGHQAGVAEVLVNLGIVLERVGRYDDAGDAFVASLRIRRTIDDKAGVGNSLMQLGSLHVRRGDFHKGLEVFEEALELQRHIGERFAAAMTLGNMGSVHVHLQNYERAMQCFEESLAVERELGKEDAMTSNLIGLSGVHFHLGHHGDAIRYLEECQRICLKYGKRRTSGVVLHNLGVFEKARGRRDRARAHLAAALEIRREFGDRAGLAKTLGVLGTMELDRGGVDEGIERFEEALQIQRELGDRAGVATTLLQLGRARKSQGRFQDSIGHYQEALDIRRATRDVSGVASVHQYLAVLYEALGDSANALAHYEEMLRLGEALGRPEVAAKALAGIGVMQCGQGRFAEAVELFERGLRVARGTKLARLVSRLLRLTGMAYTQVGYAHAAEGLLEEAMAISRASEDPPGIADAHRHLGSLRLRQGRHAEGLRHLQEALARERKRKSRIQIAEVLFTLGSAHYSLGDHGEALRYLEEALSIQRDLGSRSLEALALNSIGLALSGQGDYVGALKRFEASLRIDRERMAGARTIAALGNIAVVHARLGNLEMALASHEEVVRTARSLEDESLLAKALCNYGLGLHMADRHEEALAAYEEARDILERTWDRDSLGRVLNNLATFHLRRGNIQEAARYARRGVKLALTLSSGLAEGQGSTVRDEYQAPFGVGCVTALRQDKPADLAWYLEQGRAGSLREAFGARGALESAVMPPDLHDRLLRCRTAAKDALDAVRRAEMRGRRKEVRAAHEAWEEARTEVLRIEGRIQREAKQAAAVTLTDPDGLDEIRKHLQSGEALVLYGLTIREGVALVIRPDGVDMVGLAPSSDLEAAAARLLDEERAVDPDAVPDLRRLLIEPLALPTSVRRVLVSPTGLLAYLPFALLLRERDVAYVPSGTTYGLLRGAEGEVGAGVLALGDPDYQAGANETSLRVHRGAGATRLTPLPATRDEVAAVGDVSILGRDATEAGLQRCLASRTRWRAVHVACHGLIDPERPMLSSLALTADGTNDGFLTALEVFRMDVPADLVVLSACETGKGRIYETEGIVGLTRAFMFAGAPRVICSLWNVDDEATQALMIKFYELWNPKDGSEGLGAASALKKAQEYIRDHPDHPEWKHPYYWAAWVLWGLPD